MLSQPKLPAFGPEATDRGRRQGGAFAAACPPLELVMGFWLASGQEDDDYNKAWREAVRPYYDELKGQAR